MQKNRWNSYVLAAASTLALASPSFASGELFDLLPERVKASKTLTLATTAQFPVCQYYEEQGGPMIGFEVDLWDAIADKLGVSLNIIDTAFDGLIPGVQSGRYDLAMECISDRAEREEVVTFVDIYYGTAAIYVLEATATSGKITEDPLTVCGLSSAAVTGTNYVQQLDEVFSSNCRANGRDPVEVFEFPDNAAVMNSLYAGRVDFIISDVSSGSYILQKAPQKLAVIESPLWPKVYQGIVINKADTVLQEAVLAAAKAIVADGTYGAIMEKWSIHASSLEEPGINLTTQRPL